VLISVLEGQGVGWLKYNRVKRLMEDENYRNFILSRLNTSLDKKLLNDEEHIEDVKVVKAVFKGMSKLLTLIIYGLEQTYANNGLGGMASAYQLLEIAHTHYWMASNGTSSKTEGGMSPMSENSNSPYESKDNLSNISNSKGGPSLSVINGLNLMAAADNNKDFNIQTTGNIVAQLDPLTKIPKKRDQTEKLATPTSETLSQPTTANTQRANIKPKINHHFINPSTHADELDNHAVSPSLSLNQINNAKNGVKQSKSEISLNDRLINATAPVKSQLCSGFRYTKGVLVQAIPQSSTLVSQIPQSVIGQGPVLGAENRTYLFETIVSNPRSPLWDQMQFWEDVFLDAVAQERDIIGLDQGPSEMMERYNLLGTAEKKRLELDEDHLLAVMLYNFITFMVMMRVSKDEIRRKVRRMLGKCHIGLTMSQQVNDLLDCVNFLVGLVWRVGMLS
jgi:hypothetical protein